MRTYDKAWFDAATPDLAKGLRGGVATFVPFYLAARLDRHEFAWLALGGWLGTLVDPGGLRSTRAKTLSAFALVGGCMLALSERVAGNVWLAASCLALVAFMASLVRSLGAVWSSAGTMTAIVVAIGGAQGGPHSVRDGGYFMAGAGVAVVLSSVIWPIWTYLPLRRAEANVFEALASYAADIELCVSKRLPEGDSGWSALSRTHHRAIRVAVEEARRLALGGRARRAGETRVGSNLHVLLGLAETQFPLLVTLKESAELEDPRRDLQALLGRLNALSRRNLETAEVLRTPNLRAHEATLSIPPSGSLSRDRSSIDALLAHLDDASRAAHRLTSALDARADATTESESSPQRTLHDLLVGWRGDLSIVRDACSPRSTFFHHGLRVACTIFATAVLARFISVHPHWITVTTLAVLQPYSGATVARAAQRVLGTVLGSLAAVAITSVISSPAWLSLVIFPLSVAAVATHRRNYRLFTFFLTPVFVLVADQFVGNWWTAAARAADAAIGGGIAFVAAALIFPSRERTRLPELLARMLDAVADYALTVFDSAPDRHAEPAETRITAARRAAGIALSEAESSLERLLTEPRHDTKAQEYALQLITYGRRAAGALTTIDTYSARDLAPEAALNSEVAQRIESYVVVTLHRAAAFTRRATPGPDAPIPDLPEQLDSRLRATLARLLRGASLVEERSRGGLEHYS